MAMRAQQITGGGGGMDVDLGFVAGLAISPDPDAPGPRITVKQGADGVSDLVSSLVTVENIGLLQSIGDFSVGGLVQAIGGGGGTNTLHLNLASADDLTSSNAGDFRVTDFALDLGSADSTNSGGGDVSASYEGNVLTTGFAAPGFMVQSIGGGCGRSVLDIDRPQPIASGTRGTASAHSAASSSISVQLGGNQVSGSSGGATSFTQVGMLATESDLSPGAVLQSIGGGGGFASVDLSSGTGPAAELSAVLGGDGGSGNNGDAVTAEFSGGIISEGDGSPALILQSIGGGGGLVAAGGVFVDQVTLGASGGGNGDGGAVSLTNIGDIETLGDGSHGVVVQSIGGGGGMVLGASDATQVALSSGGSGSGGAITFTQTGDLNARGEGASALILQSLGGGGGLVGSTFRGSAGGAGEGGAISATLEGIVATPSAGTTTVVLQSIGLDGAGEMDLTLAEDGMIYAGTGGIAVEFDGGSSNRFDNFGTVMTEDGVAGLAMIGSTGDDQLNNSGLLAGNILLGAGANELNNFEDAMFFSGTQIGLGNQGNLFSNAGVFAPGTSANLIQTGLTGSFAQTSTGFTVIEVDLITDTHDALHATGTVQLAGNVDATLLNPERFLPGMKAYQIFTGDAGVDLLATDLRADSSVVLNLLGLAVNGNAIELQYDMTFAPAILQGNQIATGDYLDRVQTAGVPASLQSTFSRLLFEQDENLYAAAITQLGADFYVQQNALAIEQSHDFGRVIANCGNSSLASKDSAKPGCVWAEVSLADGTGKAVPGSPEVGYEVSSFSGGAHYQLKPHFSVALAIGYSDIELDGFDRRWGAMGRSSQLGAGAVYEVGATEISALLCSGGTSFDSTRELAYFAASTTSNRDVDVFSLEARASHRFDLGGLTLKPALTMGLTGISSKDALEQGDSAVQLMLDQSDGTFIWVMPQLFAGYDAALSKRWTMRPYLNAGLRQYLSSDDIWVAARFAEDATAAAPFSPETRLGKSVFAGEAGVEFFNRSGVQFGASYLINRSEDRNRDSARVLVSIDF